MPINLMKMLLVTLLNYNFMCFHASYSLNCFGQNCSCLLFKFLTSKCIKPCSACSVVMLFHTAYNKTDTGFAINLLFVVIAAHFVIKQRSSCCNGNISLKSITKKLLKQLLMNKEYL